MSTPVQFFVPGTPRTAGSKRSYPFKGKDDKLHVRVTDDNPKSREWKSAVSLVASPFFPIPLLGPLALDLTFCLLRPKGHYGTGRNVSRLKPSAPPFPATIPDLLKLTRGVEDALTKIAWRDDAQVVEETLRKIYDVRSGCLVKIVEATGSSGMTALLLGTGEL